MASGRLQRNFSMIPLILPTDRLIIGKSGNLKVNDIVVFKKGPRLIAHRLIYIYPKGDLVVKGDNNLKSDGRINKNKILGKVIGVVRNGHSILFSHVYLSQSSTYLRELAILNQTLGKAKIQYILLKGLPLHLYYTGKIPQRLYFDIDILVGRGDFPQFRKILKSLGYLPIAPSLFKKSLKRFSQISFVKRVKPYAVTLDVHFEPAIGFTKVPQLNKLIPSLPAYTGDLFGNIQTAGVEKNRYPILNRESFLLYLLLHLAHHNFQGIHRVELIDEFIRRQKPDIKIVINTAKKFGFEYFIYPSLLVVNKYFKGVKIPENLKLPSPLRFILWIITRRSPFDGKRKGAEAMEKIILALLLLKAPLATKLPVLLSKESLRYYLPTIRSAFFKI